MGKTQEVDAIQKGKGHGQGRTRNGITEAEAAMDAAEHLLRDLERVQARFGIDPALASRSLATAWMTETVKEEDEAEFVDTVADCLSAGLSLEAALTCWDAGGLTYDETAEIVDADPDDEPMAVATPPIARHASGAHRVLVR